MVSEPHDAIVRYASQAQPEDLTADVSEYTQLLILDTVAIALGARLAGMPTMKALDALPEANSSGATIWGTDRLTPAATAALLNGAASEVLDYQEVLIDGRNNGHAAVVLVPALLALTEMHRVTGARLVAAVATGLEINLALLRTLGRSHRSDGRGIRTTSLAAPIAAAAAGAAMIGLKPAGISHAVGIAAASLPIGLLAAMAPSSRHFSMDKDLSVGLSARHAVEAVEFAAAGITGPYDVITGPRGWLATYCHDSPAPFELPTSGAPNVGRYRMKRYPSNYGTQSAVAAALEARDAVKGPIEVVKVRVKSSSAESLSTRTLSTHVSARFSLPYSVAATLARGRLSMAEFEPDAINDSEILGLMDRIHIVADGSFEELHRREGFFPASVSLQTSQGRSQADVLDIWEGLSPSAVSDAISTKVHEILGPFWAAEQTDRMIAAIKRLSDTADEASTAKLVRQALARDAA